MAVFELLHLEEGHPSHVQEGPERTRHEPDEKELRPSSRSQWWAALLLHHRGLQWPQCNEGGEHDSPPVFTEDVLNSSELPHGFLKQAEEKADQTGVRIF